jgi:hypothetical protein
MDRDDAGMSDRRDEALENDTGMLGSEAEEPGPGRDTSLTDPDPAAASTDQQRGTVAMSEGDPMATRLGSHAEGAGVIGYDVVAAEEGPTQETPPSDRPGYEPERPAVDDAVATAPAAAATTPAAYEPVEDTGSADRFTTAYQEEPERLDRPGPQEPGVQESVYDQEADRARRPSEGG